MTFRLLRDGSGYALVESGFRRRPLRVDFAAVHARVTRGGRELLTRAISARVGMHVIDCTAGLGTDSFVMASRGCEVTMVERSNTLYLMLEDALARAREIESLAPTVQRMRLVRGDARHVLSSIEGPPPDVVYIDPMFPGRKKSALVKSELQVLQRLLGADEPVLTLVKIARAVATERVVVKRPLRGGALEGIIPTGSVTGKASRFDIFAPDPKVT
ncbi:MAG: class I SAM-dependent methyltransferase [Gammaproteobacteria bacterium]|nr:class I SAM-dependent methyltransferase [Gammaproteobacteria bacterium]